jgi:hypothetical protein
MDQGEECHWVETCLRLKNRLNGELVWNEESGRREEAVTSNFENM